MFEWFAPIWAFLHFKKLIPIFLILSILFQTVAGYFRYFKAYFFALKFNKRRAFLYIFISGLIFSASLLWDPYVNSWARNSSGKAAEFFWSYGAEMGRSIWIFLALFYLLVIWNNRFRAVAFGALLGTSLTGLCATALKWVVLRARPDVGLGHQAFFNWQHLGTDNRDFQSFPSGDVAIVAGACFFLMMIYKKRPVLSSFFFLTSLATAFARMHWDRHWFSDTVTSLLLAAGWAFFISGYEFFRINNLKKI